MTIQRILFTFLSISIIWLASTGCSIAGPLRLLAPGGPESAVMGGAGFSESDTDMQRPEALLGSARNSLSLTRECETVFYEKENDRVLNLHTSRKTVAAVRYTLPGNSGARTALAADIYGAETRLFTDDQFADTQFRAKGRGGAFALAHGAGNLRLGIFYQSTDDSISGASGEAVQQVDVLDAGTVIPGYMDAERYGMSISARAGKRLDLGFTYVGESAHAALHFADADNEFRFPVNIEGKRRSWRATWKAPAPYTIEAAVHHGSYGHIDDITHYSSTLLGRWKSSAGFTMRSLHARKQGSEHHLTTFGFEDYTGAFTLAGAADLLGTSANLLSGYYLLHANGFLKSRTVRYAAQWRKGNYTWRAGYAYSRGHAFLHYDTQRGGLAVLLGLMPANAVASNRNYSYRRHQLGLGVEKQIAPDVVAQYSLVQTIPLFKEQGRVRIPDTTQKSRTVRGGALHLFSIIYFFD